jgi:glycolate oxidase
MQMPDPDQGAISRRRALIDGLRAIVPGEGVITQHDALAAFDSDALIAYRQRPLAAVLPETADQVARILRLCRDLAIKVVPRGGGTGLSGGALPVADGIVLAMGRFNRILAVDLENRVARVQPGVTNLAISKAVEARGFYYAPDPSSQIACTIGGNVAENSGGVHCLKYGMTSNNVLGIEMITIDGEILRFGGSGMDQAGIDMLGLMVGAEGLLGVVTEVTVRLLPIPETQRAALIGFPSNRAAADTVAQIIAAGIIPAAIEMMDRSAIQVTEDFVHAGYPLDVEALLIVELDGPPVEVDSLLERVTRIARGLGSQTLKISGSEAERLTFWAGRKAAFPAVGRISRDYMTVDGSIPRGKMPDVLDDIAAMAIRHGLRVVNVFHAGDGNLHPLILFDASLPGQLQAAEDFAADILRKCVEVGGVLTGEHGVGIEKRDLMQDQFSEVDLLQQRRLKDVFDPLGLFNPGKVFPLLHRCVDGGKMVVSGGNLAFADLPRF